MTAVRPENSAGAAGQPPRPSPANAPAGPGPAAPPGRDRSSGHAYPAPDASWYPPPRGAAASHDPYGTPPPQGYPPAAQGYPRSPQGAAGPYGPQGPLQGPAEGFAAQESGWAPAPGYGASQGHAGAAPVEPPPPRRRNGGESTAEMPLPAPGDADPHAADPHDDGYDRRAAGAPADAPVTTGGRAERRKAAKRGGRRRPPAAAPSAALALPSGEPAAPVSRVEARRAAKAAKPGVGVLVSQGVGELFITFGVLMLLFVVYQLWYTNVLADEQTSGATNTLQHSWASDTKTSSDAGEPSSFPHGTDFAIIYIPKLDVKAPIAEGVDKTTILDKGDVGHYDGAQETAMPWAASGNFALAGHRNTHGEPFRYINKLVPGDKVVVETKGMYYTYAITSTLPQTSPSNVSVIEPVPPQSGFTAPGRYITLTTCTPEFTSEFRLIVWGKMVAEQPRTKGMPAALLGG